MKYHSLAIIPLTNLYWNYKHIPVPRNMFVDFSCTKATPQNRYYKLTDIMFSENKISAICHKTDESAICRITATKSGNKITLEHSQHHYSGLTQSYTLYDRQISSGEHVSKGGMERESFSGTISDKDRMTITVRRADGDYTYSINLRS